MKTPDDLTRLQTALRQARQQTDPKRQVDLLEKIGQLEANRGMDNEAISTYTEALAAYEKLDEPDHILQVLDTLSVLMVKTENSQCSSPSRYARYQTGLMIWMMRIVRCTS